MDDDGGTLHRLRVTIEVEIWDKDIESLAVYWDHLFAKSYGMTRGFGNDLARAAKARAFEVLMDLTRGRGKDLLDVDEVLY